MSHERAQQAHLQRLRDLANRLSNCQTEDAEARIQKLIDAENTRWANRPNREDEE